MKKNKRRIDVRIKPYLFERLQDIATKLETTYTDVLETCLERGMNWQINKIRREIDEKFLEDKLSPKTNNDNKPDLNKPLEERITAQEKQMIEAGQKAIEILNKISKTPTGYDD